MTHWFCRYVEKKMVHDPKGDSPFNIQSLDYACGCVCVYECLQFCRNDLRVAQSIRCRCDCGPRWLSVCRLSPIFHSMDSYWKWSSINDFLFAPKLIVVLSARLNESYLGCCRSYDWSIAYRLICAKKIPWYKWVRFLLLLLFKAKLFCCCHACAAVALRLIDWSLALYLCLYMADPNENSCN